MCLRWDELTGEAGYQTGLEAFVDLLSREKVYMSKLRYILVWM